MKRHLELWFGTRPPGPPAIGAPPPRAGTVAIARADDGTAEVRIVRRPDGLLTFEIEAWTNFADAGGGAHVQWHTFHPAAAVLTDSIERIIELATLDAQERGLMVGSFDAARP